MTSWPAIARRIRVPTGFALAALYLYLAHPKTWSLAAGAAIVIPGLLIRALASGHVQKNEQLAVSGPYGYTRNPLYLGSMVMAAGFVVAARSWWIAALVAVMFVAIYLPVIRSEEVFLRQRFPEFDDYAKNVPRLYPRTTPFGNAAHRFSWDLYWKHREYNACLGSALVMAALIAKRIWLPG